MPAPNVTAQRLGQGTEGTLLIGGLRAGTLTSWHLDISPTTKMPTLFGEGHFLRLFLQSVGGPAEARLTASMPPVRIGRPKPKVPRPFTLTGVLFSLTSTRIVISEGVIPGWMPSEAHG